MNYTFKKEWEKLPQGRAPEVLKNLCQKIEEELRGIKPKEIKIEKNLTVKIPIYHGQYPENTGELF